MGRISKEDRDANALKLASIWLNQNDVWLYYSEIKKEATKMGFYRKKLSRYLDWMIKEGDEKKFDVEQEGPRTRKFRPTREYWEKNFKWIPVRRDANDAEYLFFIELASNITEKFDDTCRRAIKEVSGEAKGLSRKDLNTLNALIAKLVRDVRLDLSSEYFNEGSASGAVYGSLRGNVKRAVMAYMDLWVFISTTKGAREEFSRQMSSLQNSIEKMK